MVQVHFTATIWPDRQAVKTPPFHGGFTGSNPVRVTRKEKAWILPKDPGFFCFPAREGDKHKEGTDGAFGVFRIPA